MTFTPTDTVDYTTATSAVTINVNQATPTITWATPADITYGTALRCHAVERNGVGGSGTPVYSPAAGTVLAQGKPDVAGDVHAFRHGGLHDGDDAVHSQCQPGDADDHVGNTGGHHLWHGLECHPVECNGVGGGHAGVQSGSGTVLSAGASQALQVTFTPTDTVDYTAATDTVSINVNKATPTITWATPADITSGTALSATQLNATGSVAARWCTAWYRERY